MQRGDGFRDGAGDGFHRSGRVEPPDDAGSGVFQPLQPPQADDEPTTGDGSPGLGDAPVPAGLLHPVGDDPLVKLSAQPHVRRNEEPRRPGPGGSRSRAGGRRGGRFPG